MKKVWIMISAVVLLWGMCSPAGAIVVTVDDDLADNLLIQKDQTVTGKFDINPPALPDDGNYNKPYDVTSATASFTFQDDKDVAFKNTQSFTSRTNWATCNGDRFETITTYNYFIDENDEVQLTIGAQVSKDGTSWYDVKIEKSSTTSVSTTTHKHAYTYDCNCDVWGCDTCTGYNTHYITTHQTIKEVEQTSGYTGELTIDVAFDPVNIADLSLDGEIEFDVTGTDGDIILKSGKLTAQVEANPIPEPAAFLILGMGLIGAAGYSRKKA